MCYFHEQFLNHSLKPSLLRRHLQLKHSNFTDKPLDCFEKELSEMKVAKIQSLNFFYRWQLFCCGSFIYG
jgi:hypothetical protein